MTEEQIRLEIVKANKELITHGLNRGTSGNISVRCGSGLLLTPSAIGSDDMLPSMVAYMEMDQEDKEWSGSIRPTTEWRFHRDILIERSDINAVVHTHAPNCTTLAVARKPIPAIHYMMAAFGGANIRVADYARYGTIELSQNILIAMKDRNGCLMANHGMVVGGADLTQAMWLAYELEELARIFYTTELAGSAHVLSDKEIEDTAHGFSTYGVQNKASAE